MENENTIAIVCCHVISGKPILRAVNGEPMDDEDSGWQFTCGGGGHNSASDAEIWLLKEVAAHDPSILGFLDKKSPEIGRAHV